MWIFDILSKCSLNTWRVFHLQKHIAVTDLPRWLNCLCHISKACDEICLLSLNTDAIKLPLSYSWQAITHTTHAGGSNWMLSSLHCCLLLWATVSVMMHTLTHKIWYFLACLTCFCRITTADTVSVYSLRMLLTSGCVIFTFVSAIQSAQPLITEILLRHYVWYCLVYGNMLVITAVNH